jgi:excisionase family DNA binding protein
MNQGLLDKKQVARILNTSARHVMDLARRGVLRRVLVGRLVRFRLEDIETYIKGQINQGVAQ